MRPVLIVLLAVAAAAIAAPSATAKSRLLAAVDGTVTIEWPDRVCTQAGVEDEPPITFTLSEVDTSPAPSSTPSDEVELAPESDDGVLVDGTDWPLFPIAPWRVVYRSDGSYDAWHDWTCAASDVAAEPLDPDARTLMRAARASHHAKVKAVRDKARRRGLYRGTTSPRGV